MRKLIKYMLMVVLWVTSCYKEDLSNCPSAEGDSYIRFVYDYNMSYEDLFHHQVSKVDLYCFDKDGLFIRTLSDEVGNGTFPRDYKIEIPEDIRNIAYQYIAWAGLNTAHHQATVLTAGTSRMEDLKVNLTPRSNNLVNTNISPLWYGSLLGDNIQTGNSDNIQTISLIKDTNTFRITLQLLDEEYPIDVEKFDFRIESANGSYNYQNKIASTQKWVYEPFLKKNDPAAGAVTEIHTMRLMEDCESKLIIRHKTATSPLLDIKLNDYLNALKLEAYSYMSLQEYMDREDSFRILVFIRNENPGDPDNPKYVAANVNINGWEIREQDIK